MLLCRILVLSACEIGFALRIVVKISRFSRVEKISNLKCEAF